MKTKRIFTYIVMVLFINVCFSFSKFPVDFQEYEEFADMIYDDNKNCSFSSIADYLFDDRACIRVLIICHNNSKIETKQMMVSKLFDLEEIEEVNVFLGTLGSFLEKNLIQESEENIYDVSIPNLICLNYKVKYSNLETNEQLWLKKADDKILIYRYTICLDKIK